jgi:hypothetical protein
MSDFLDSELILEIEGISQRIRNREMVEELDAAISGDGTASTMGGHAPPFGVDTGAIDERVSKKRLRADAIEFVELFIEQGLRKVKELEPAEPKPKKKLINIKDLMNGSDE